MAKKKTSRRFVALVTSSQSKQGSCLFLLEAVGCETIPMPDGPCSHEKCLAVAYRHVYGILRRSMVSDNGKTLELQHGTFRLEELADKSVLLQVIEMDEAFRAGEKRLSPTFVASNGVRVNSLVSPCFVPTEPNTIYLRGTDRKGDMQASVGKPCSRDKLAKALKDWDEHWPYWTSALSDEEINDIIARKYIVAGSRKGKWFIVEMEK